MRLDGKMVVMTGAAGGIGSLLCRELRARGARLVGVDRVVCEECDETILADLGSREGLEQLAGSLAGREVDILVNLAGMQYFGPIERQDPGSIWAGYVVNLIAPATLIRAVLPQMQARGHGQIVNIGSVMGAVNYPHFATYSSSKCGLRGLSEALRRELGRSPIAITHIAPRAVRTGFNNAEVNRFMEVTGMKADEPEAVAAAIAEAIGRRRKEVTLGGPERLFTRLNGAFPRLIDAGLESTTAKARALFA
ncbi:SDR family NAD(P)-dependent oxidoreductase [Sphingomonas astaxanthinifaciens]|uniref:Short chain dehydrogenase n=1 Tax=Sphingomonas astaxanthinifaciens DSM 22298 TaxID=1123267 RepID=A0ABQ5Z2N6_9SPHN|nr:SDR family NAD(P)-dependent oxidoreductase [Sphingomonas astaxanthinifaciens]GLR46352.1 short chain dehydrogenase [Sphingomonas astaxanthinifaciens DSM 22298]